MSHSFKVGSILLLMIVGGQSATPELSFAAARIAVPAEGNGRWQRLRVEQR